MLRPVLWMDERILLGYIDCVIVIRYHTKIGYVKSVKFVKNKQSEWYLLWL